MTAPSEMNAGCGTRKGSLQQRALLPHQFMQRHLIFVILIALCEASRRPTSHVVAVGIAKHTLIVDKRLVTGCLRCLNDTRRSLDGRSRTRTWSPAASSARATAAPTNPEAPVTSDTDIRQAIPSMLLVDKSTGRNKKSRRRGSAAQ